MIFQGLISFCFCIVYLVLYVLNFTIHLSIFGFLHNADMLLGVIHTPLRIFSISSFRIRCREIVFARLSYQSFVDIGPVRDLKIFADPGPVQSEIFKISSTS